MVILGLSSPNMNPTNRLDYTLNGLDEFKIDSQNSYFLFPLLKQRSDDLLKSSDVLDSMYIVLLHTVLRFINSVSMQRELLKSIIRLKLRSI